ncbi:hypothetical protein GM3708_1460 [Geminocystis sp. NIES-3708]|uniref:O-linked N-acetylglucosamine transferase, SPINDLY family protein n=1 Tax=Geminocystis sp. NIES-3708 TaxID=1615909 RepID=UPI0005FC9C22|nr:hypothetical protein [Geminocystis sp. NIES-3708]BAQ61054.1 hypothetical protein GM3708_1460 [Geminocystis sp. NIES-3708]
MSWHLEVQEFLTEQKFDRIVSFYENLMENNPDNINDYIYLGLAYLLAGNEAEAQSTWFYLLTLEDEELLNLLSDILEQEVQRQLSLENKENVWLIRSYLKEINPNYINNILYLIDLEIILNKYIIGSLNNWNLEKLLVPQTPDINLKFLWELLPKLIIVEEENSLHFIEFCLSYYIYDLSICLQKISDTAQYFCYRKPNLAIQLTNLCLQKTPNDWYLQKNLCLYLFSDSFHQNAIELAKKIYEQQENTEIKVYLNGFLLELMHKSNLWLECDEIFKRHKMLLKTITQEKECRNFYDNGLVRLIRPLLHSEDNPRENRKIQNRLAQLFENHIKDNFKINKNSELTENKKEKHKIKIGYIGYTFRMHSVGWLCRWLFQYHDRENFEIYIYLINQSEDEMTEKWFKNKVDYNYKLSGEIDKIAQQIINNKIDILIDLDAITNQTTSAVMSLKPAPIQVTWLGSDASGIPSIDYFIADTYVLPSNAQKYYTEKIWRLPYTYLGINGFEVNVPTLTRENLDIPSESTIYLTIQNAFKRHPNCIHLQMKIIKSVADSYLLIKGSGDDQLAQQLYLTIAQQEGVEQERIKFLEMTLTEATHRANIKIADVVLDTYPYNGATTTLETLWMEVPLVTRVGEQFAARNSYTFMMNAGITEGIAWSDEEYIEWGIKLGTDENLRKEVSWKLRQSKKTSPLWNGKQFTKEMEKAYQQMWEIYVNLYNSK